jgi:hypothetical protein
MIARRLFLLGFAGALAFAFGCSGGSDNGGGTTTPAIVCTDGGAAGANGVTLKCGGAVSSTTEQVVVVMGGQNGGTTTLRGLNFDITYAPANLDFVPAASYVSPLFPNALIAVSLSDGIPGRLVVSIQQPGSSPNIAVPAGQFAVLTLTFARAAGMSFAPTPLAFENSEATNASVAVGFASSLALSYP